MGCCCRLATDAIWCCLTVDGWGSCFTRLSLLVHSQHTLTLIHNHRHHHHHHLLLLVLVIIFLSFITFTPFLVSGLWIRLQRMAASPTTGLRSSLLVSVPPASLSATRRDNRSDKLAADVQNRIGSGLIHLSDAFISSQLSTNSPAHNVSLFFATVTPGMFSSSSLIFEHNKLMSLLWKTGTIQHLVSANNKLSCIRFVFVDDDPEFSYEVRNVMFETITRQ